MLYELVLNTLFRHYFLREAITPISALPLCRLLLADVNIAQYFDATLLRDQMPPRHGQNSARVRIATLGFSSGDALAGHA